MSELIDNYIQFLKSKVPQAELQGFAPPSDCHPSLFPHQRDIAKWMIEGGRRACFASFGLGKTRIHLQIAKWVVEKTGGKFLIIAPLGVRQEFTKSDGPAMDLEIEFHRTTEDAMASSCKVIITNYDSVVDGKMDVSKFEGAGLDESSVLRSYGSLTYQSFLKLFKSVKYRFVFTATPSPNRFKELIHYGGFLGVMDTGEALTRFFQRDSTQANNLTLYPHMEKHFWMWLSSWSVFIQYPSDLGYSDEGYDLPDIKIHWHKLDVDHKKAWNQFDSWGQSQLLRDDAQGLAAGAEIKRESIATRIDKAIEIINSKSNKKHWIIWHDLEAERDYIQRHFKEAKTVYGSQDLEEREELIMGFSRGEYRILATKPIIAGSGCNFQKHCADAIFIGVGYKFNDLIQAVHRIQRFQQKKTVNIHIIYLESESKIKDELEAKWQRHDELVKTMTELLKTNRLTNKTTMELIRTMGCERLEVKGEKFSMIRNDTVLECDVMKENSVDMILTSIPFGNQYEYSPSFNDMGHNYSNVEFFKQMDYLAPNLLRVLKPGRIAAIHVKDRIRFGNVTGFGGPTVDRFSDKTADCFEKAGFVLLARITIDTDVVRENNQTYRLGWSENAKDSSKMGAGMPEYVLVFRKLPSDLSDAYADTPVKKSKAEYTRADWQIDAAGLWRSNGNRLPDPEIMVHMNMEDIKRLWIKHCMAGGYDHAEHVELAKGLENLGKLPASFMLFPAISRNKDIWTDITRMRTMNAEQSKRNLEMHVCPLQFDIINRLITRYTNPGEIVFDPFAGIGSVPYRAIKMGRKGLGTELNEEYWRFAFGYCELAEKELTAPSLFDLSQIECSKPKQVSESCPGTK